MTSNPLPLFRLVGLGFGFWFIATVLFRLFGQYLLIPGDTVRMVIVILLGIPAMFMLVYLVLHPFQLRGVERVAAGTYLLAPSLMLDGLISLFAFQQVFPNLPSEAAAQFAGTMCAGYSAGLLATFIRGNSALTQSS